MFHSSVLGDPGSEWEKEGCDGFRFPTTPQRGSAGISQGFWNPLSNCPPGTDGEIEALSREGFAKVTGEAGSPGLGLLGPWRSPVQPALGPAAAPVLTSFRSVFKRSLESSMRLASMKSLYLSRTVRIL